MIERATFDAEPGINDPDVTVLDISHPLVRRLIEEVKQSAFRVGATGDASRYGRTAYVITSDVGDVTALFHVLARYVVNTEPISIVEELVPLAIPVYSGDPPGSDATHRLLSVSPTPETRTEAQVQESLTDALAIESLEEWLKNAVEGRRRELVAERRSLRQQLEQREGTQATEWLQGIDNLSPGSFDMLAVTIYYPA